MYENIDLLELASVAIVYSSGKSQGTLGGAYLRTQYRGGNFSWYGFTVQRNIVLYTKWFFYVLIIITYVYYLFLQNQ